MADTSVIDDLARARFQGAVIDLNHEDYDRLRRVYNDIIVRRPAAVVRVETASDVQKAVSIAANRILPLAVRCGGHSFAGLGTCDHGIVCDLSRMNAVVVYPETRMVEVGGGALLGDVDAAGLKYGLVTPAGVVSHTGVGGLTLGGGMGYLSRRLGLTIDSLVSVEIVTADGSLMHVSAQESPDLFWAIRGGGGNFGVVTKFRFRMHVLGPTTIRRWTYPITTATEILMRYREAIKDAPRELTTAFILAQDRLLLRAIWSGSSSGGEVFMERLGSFPGAMPDTRLDTTFLELQQASDELLPWGRRYYSKGGFLGALDDRAIDVMARSVPSMTLPGLEVYCLQLGGAIQDVAEDDTAYSGRAGEFYWIAQGAWDRPDHDEQGISWCRRAANGLAMISLKANYVNEQADIGVARSAYGETKYERLAHLKWKYDPTNLFRLNQNIEPKRM